MAEPFIIDLEEELAAVTETGLFKSREAFLTAAVNTLFAARPDLREAVACRLYEKGVFSLGRAAAWAGVSIEDMKESLHRAGISRVAPEGLEETEAMARSASVAWRHRTAPSRAVVDVSDLTEVWKACRHLPTLSTLASVDQGLEHRRSLPDGVKAHSDQAFPGAVRGYARWNRGLEIHELPEEVWVNVESAAVLKPASGTATGTPQVLMSSAPASRGPWRLKALIDERGHAVTGHFLTVRPREEVPLGYLWALLNSPFANGFAFAHSAKGQPLKKTLSQLPVPRASETSMAAVAEATRAYFAEVRTRSGPDRSGPGDEAAKGLLLRVDAAILRLYALPPRLERKLLDLFSGSRRPGVPFQLSEYFPSDFEPAIPLHFYLSEEYRRSTVGALRARHQVVTPPEIRKALRRAIEDFSE